MAASALKCHSLFGQLRWFLLVSSIERNFKSVSRVSSWGFRPIDSFYSGYWQLSAECPCLWLRGLTVVKWITCFYCHLGFNQCPACPVRVVPMTFFCLFKHPGLLLRVADLHWSVFNSELLLLCRMRQFGSLIHARTVVAMVILWSANLLFAKTLGVPLRRYGSLIVA